MLQQATTLREGTIFDRFAYRFHARRYYSACGGAEEYRDGHACLCVCPPAYISGTTCPLSCQIFIKFWPWASAHRGKWGQQTPWKKMEKLKSENMQKEQFSMFMLYFESNQGRQV